MYINFANLQESIDSILNPAYLPHPPTPDGARVVEDGSSNDSVATPTAVKRGIPFVPPPHPDIINPGPSFNTGTHCMQNFNAKLVLALWFNFIYM